MGTYPPPPPHRPKSSPPPPPPPYRGSHFIDGMPSLPGEVIDGFMKFKHWLDEYNVKECTFMGVKIGDDTIKAEVPRRFTVSIGNETIEDMNKGPSDFIKEIARKTDCECVSQKENIPHDQMTFTLMKKPIVTGTENTVLDYVTPFGTIEKLGVKFDAGIMKKAISEIKKHEVECKPPSDKPIAKTFMENTCTKCFADMPEGTIKCKSCGTIRKISTGDTGTK